MPRKKSLIQTCAFGILLTIILAFILIPFLWALSTAFKEAPEILGGGVNLLPKVVTLENFINVWNNNKFSIYFFNSLFISSISVIFIVLFSLFNGYALSRYKFKGKQLFMIILLATQLLPTVIFVIPLFIIFKKLGLINNSFSLILFYTTMQIPFNTFLMKGFISQIPVTLDEAAMVDGANRFRIIFRIIPPIVLPGLIAVGAFAFISCWNEFLVGFSFITAMNKFTIPIGLKFMIGEYSVDYGTLAAGSIIALIPPALLFGYVQKYMVQGLGTGSVKG
jgi:multiple sugar transport system permease protein